MLSCGNYTNIHVIFATGNFIHIRYILITVSDCFQQTRMLYFFIFIFSVVLGPTLWQTSVIFPHDSAPLSILLSLKYIPSHWWHSTFCILSPSPYPPHFYLFCYFHVTEWEVDIILIIISQLPTEFQLSPHFIDFYLFLYFLLTCLIVTGSHF